MLSPTAATINNTRSPPARQDEPVDLGSYQGQLVFIAGPPGSGKKELIDMLLEAPKDNEKPAKTPGCCWPLLQRCRTSRTFDTVITRALRTTGRERNSGEVDGREYHFVSPQEFRRQVRHGDFVESAARGSDMYGTTRDAIAAKDGPGHIILVETSRAALTKLRSDIGRMADLSNFKARFIFIQPPDFMYLEAALRGEGRLTESEVERCLREARDEVAYANTGVYDKIFVNRNRKATCRELRRFIVQGK